jgi:hypothetical protein
MTAKLVPLKMWAERRYEKPPSARTLRRWAHNGNIFPRPKKEGGALLVPPHAIYVDTSDPNYLENVAAALNESPPQ